jgi:hypothetical protein
MWQGLKRTAVIRSLNSGRQRLDSKLNTIKLHRRADRVKMSCIIRRRYDSLHVI